MIKAHYWKRIGNFGDILVPIILKWLTGQEIKWVPKSTKGKVLCVGSEMARGVLQSGDIVWGYGNRDGKKVNPPKNVHFLAVRGKTTRDLIQEDVPEVYGDPGILMPLIYPANISIKKEYEIGLIPHHAERHLFKDIKNSKINVLDVAVENPYKFIDELLKCRIIMTSSLHTCIVAESYGIPVVWFVGHNDKTEGFRIKFNDYFSGTERKPQKPVQFKNRDLKEIFLNAKNILPKPVFYREKFLNAWRNSKYTKNL